jgi:hypothetical protein
MSKIIQHEFYDGGFLIKEYQPLIIGDMCKFCGLIVNRHIDRHINNEVTIAIQKDQVNEKYPCITEEEYIIKKLLE